MGLCRSLCDGMRSECLTCAGCRDVMGSCALHCSPEYRHKTLKCATPKSERTYLSLSQHELTAGRIKNHGTYIEDFSLPSKRNAKKSSEERPLLERLPLPGACGFQIGGEGLCTPPLSIFISLPPNRLSFPHRAPGATS